MGKYLRAMALGIMAACSSSNGTAQSTAQKTAETEAQRPQSIDERTEERLNVPESVRQFRRRLSASPNADDYALVQLAPHTKKYILTLKDGSNLRAFARGANLDDWETDGHLYVSKADEFHNYGQAFILLPNSYGQRHVLKRFDEKDKNGDSVLSLEEQ